MIERLNAWWSDRSLRTKLFAVAGIPVLAAATAAGVFAFSQQSERQASDQVIDTIEVQRTIDQLLGELVDVETGARGYLVTGEPRWLEPYDLAIGDIPGTLDHLQALLANDPSQKARADALRPAVSGRLDLAAQLLATAPISESNRADVLSTMTRGKAAMDDLRLRLAAMSAEENRRLAERQAKLDADRVAGTLAIGGSLVGAILGGGIVALLLSFSVVGRIRRVEQNSRRLARGEPLGGLPTGGDEIGQLGATVTEAQALINARTAELNATLAEAQDLYDNAPVGYHSLDAEGRFVRINATELSWLGYERARIIGADPARIIFSGVGKTEDEIRAAALQFVRKVSGYRKPSKVNEEAFERAVEDVAKATGKLLESLAIKSPTPA